MPASPATAAAAGGNSGTPSSDVSSVATVTGAASGGIDEGGPVVAGVVCEAVGDVVGSVAAAPPDADGAGIPQRT